MDGVRIVAVSLLLQSVHGALPPPLPLVCTAATPSLGCFNDSWTRTFPFMASNGGPTDPFGANATLETCAYLCASASPPWPLAAIENGGQCFCTNSSQVAAAQALLRPASQCSTPCAGNPLQACGGEWRVQAFSFSCEAYTPGAWANPALSVETRVDDLLSRLDATGLVAQLTQNGADIYASGVQLPRYIVSQECLAGFDGGSIYIAPPVPSIPSSGFPQPVNMGNTWDADLVRELASAISDEARAAFTHMGRPSLTCMSPNLNVARSPQWGRNLESFSEEPALIASLGVAYINGIQRGLPDNASVADKYLKIAAVPKHLGAYSVECSDPSGKSVEYPNCPVYRSTFNAVVDEMDLRETYLVGWEAAAKEAYAQGVMCSYNEINGVPACCSGSVLDTILNTEWAFGGFVISDADAVALAGRVRDQPPDVNGHGWAPSLYEAAISAFKNGTTISLEDTDPDSAAYALSLPTALAAGRITLEELRAVTRRALLPRFNVGLYDPEAANPWASIPASVIESPAHHALARRAAAASYVLLKNDGLLPFATVAAGGPRTIAVVGTVSNCSTCSINRYSGHPAHATSAWEGISAAATAAGAVAVFGGEGLDAQAVAAVAAADVAVVLLTGEAEGESHDRARIGLPPQQRDFIELLATNTSTRLVVCIVSGGAVDSSPAIDAAGAAIAMYFGGMEAGSALADVLWGLAEPTGVLAHTIYRTSWENVSNFLDMGMRSGQGRGQRYLKPAAVERHVLFPFGFGGGYTQWTTEIMAILPPSLSVSALSSGTNVSITLSVRNVGTHVGSRVAYATLSRADSPPGAEEWPFQWLPRAGFAKVYDVPPDGCASVVLTLSARDLSRWDAGAHAYTVRAGTYALAVRDDVSLPPTFVVTA